MILTPLSTVYGAAATWRRRWYARDPQRRKRLSRPVVSVGNLRVGGAGKTPIVSSIARLLLAAGQRPAVLTRGYGRRVQRDGVTIVSDGRAILEDVQEAGDEPLMLARALTGVPVIVANSRYMAGLVAERRLGATVHVLDDGFQHLELARTVDLLLVDEPDLADHPLPAGWLREPIANASAADAVLVTAGYATAAERIGRALGVATAFRVTRALGAPRAIADGTSVVVPDGARVFAAAGIARPDRFFADLAAAGWKVVGTMRFRDHHPFAQRDVQHIATAARTAAASIVLTTEKDAVRLAPCDLRDLPIAAVPLTASIEPEADFSTWLLGRL